MNGVTSWDSNEVAVGASVFLAGIVSFATVSDFPNKMSNESHPQAVDAKRGHERTNFEGVQMNGSHRLFLGIGAVLVFLAGFGFHKSLAQPQKNNDWVAEQVNLPSDIHPETLSRTTRSKESDFTDEEDKQIFSRINNAAGSKQLVSRWLGPTGIRLQIPKYAAAISTVGSSLRGIDPKYHELTVAVATRETGNRDEFLNHHDDAVKAFGNDVEEIVRLRKSTQGLDSKQAAIIEFGRELFKMPRTQSVSSKAFADLEKNFGRRGALTIIGIMCYYDTNFLLMRSYDQHMDTSGKCPGPHMGCLDPKNPPPTW
jgi:hypothetical protein